MTVVPVLPMMPVMPMMPVVPMMPVLPVVLGDCLAAKTGLRNDLGRLLA